VAALLLTLSRLHPTAWKAHAGRTRARRESTVAGRVLYAGDEASRLEIDDAADGGQRG
jgi:hypothetical protein